MPKKRRSASGSVKSEDVDSDDDGGSKSYRIVRMFAPELERESYVVRRGLSLKEARKHCSDPSTHGKIEKDGVMYRWFDGYDEE